MKCSICATDNPINSRFCGNCRNPLGEPSEVSTEVKTGETAPDQESQERGTRIWVISIVLWVWGVFLVFGGATELSESGVGGLFIIFGGIISVYGGILRFLSKTLFGLFTPGKWAGLTAAAGFLLAMVGIDNLPQ